MSQEIKDKLQGIMKSIGQHQVAIVDIVKAESQKLQGENLYTDKKDRTPVSERIDTLESAYSDLAMSKLKLEAVIHRL